MSKYKIHMSADGKCKGYGPNEAEYQPNLDDGDYLTYTDTPPRPSSDDLFASLRFGRDAKLRATDKYLLPDYPITADALEQVKTYRSALRDLPDQPGAPWDGGGIETPWPELPSVG